MCTYHNQYFVSFLVDMVAMCIYLYHYFVSYL